LLNQTNTSRSLLQKCATTSRYLENHALLPRRVGRSRRSSATEIHRDKNISVFRRHWCWPTFTVLLSASTLI